jgi:hypothetical protein
MPTDIVIATDKPSYNTTGLVTIVSAAAYDAAAPTATAPSTTSQTFLLPTNLGDKPSLLRLVPFCGSSVAPTSSTFTVAGIRVVGWSAFNQTSGTPVYIPAVLADLTTTLGSAVPSLTVNSVAQYFFNTVTVAGGAPAVNLYSPGTVSAATNTACEIVIDTVGHQYITLQFKGTNANSPTMGAFYAFI